MELMEPFYRVKREKPINISFDVDENGVFSYSDPLFVNIVIHIKSQNTDIILGI